MNMAIGNHGPVARRAFEGLREPLGDVILFPNLLWHGGTADHVAAALDVFLAELTQGEMVPWQRAPHPTKKNNTG